MSQVLAAQSQVGRFDEYGLSGETVCLEYDNCQLIYYILLYYILL